MKHEELQFAMFDLTRRVGATKTLANEALKSYQALRNYDDKSLTEKEIDHALHTLEFNLYGVMRTLDGEDGFGYSLESSQTQWDHLKQSVDKEEREKGKTL